MSIVYGLVTFCGSGKEKKSLCPQKKSFTFIEEEKHLLALSPEKA